MVTLVFRPIRLYQNLQNVTRFDSLSIEWTRATWGVRNVSIKHPFTYKSSFILVVFSWAKVITNPVVRQTEKRHRLQERNRLNLPFRAACFKRGT